MQCARFASGDTRTDNHTTFSPAQSLFLLPEVDAVRSLPTNPQVAVEISDGTLVWEGGGPSAQASPSVRTSMGQQRPLDRYPHPPALCPGYSKKGGH